MVSAIEGLNVLVNKEPVVATHVGVFDEETAHQTYSRYRSESETFVVAPEIHRYQNQFVNTVLENQTTLACLVAPFGYGKTSTAISIWNACEQAGILAVPPFSCNSVAEMGQSIATALVFRLEQVGNAHAATGVQKVFDEYLVSSAQRLAEQDAAQYGIDINVALKSIEDKIRSGYLQLEASATHFLRFLEQLVDIGLKAGFKGLVVIVDEFQQFLGNINKSVITNFRTLIWGLQTRAALPLGFLITMDPDTERNLTDRGADILHRIRNHGLYLTFSNVYDREFPRELWSRYAETLDFTRDSSNIVDNATLEAIGQICERSDLSNGPRTAINIFQRIAVLYTTRRRSYSPIDLIDDFLTGDIRFDGDHGKIASLVNEICSYDYIKRVPERVQTIKLISAFPRGCPAEAASRYGLGETFAYLVDELRGEVLVELPEGMALVDLQKVGKPQNKLNIILKKYWLQITEAEIISDKALQYFAEYGVKPLFPPMTSHQNGWQADSDRFLLTSSGGYFRTYTGTFFEEYPQRHIAVQIAFNLDQIVESEDYIDAQFVFLIQKGEVGEHSPFSDVSNTPTFVIPIPIHRPFSRQLPRDIREIERFLSPVVLTPGVLISLLNYIHDQVPRVEGISEQERQRIQDTEAKLQEFLLAMCINDEVFASFGIVIYSRGMQAFRDALFNILRTRYPRYQTLVTTAGWKRLLEQYRQTLGTIGAAERRGMEPLTKKKSDLALIFDQRQYAGFESYAKQFNGLVEVMDWRGDTGSLVFHRHPHENELIEIASTVSGIAPTELYMFSRSQGYLPDETAYLVEFLLLRGYLEHDEVSDNFVLASTFSHDELTNLARSLVDELDFISTFGSKHTNDALREHTQKLLNQLEGEIVDLPDAQIRLLQYQRQVQAIRLEVITDLRSVLQTRIQQLYRYKVRFSDTLPQSATGLPLDTHINEAQKILQEQMAQASARIDKRISHLRSLVAESLDIEPSEAVAFRECATRIHQQLSEDDETGLKNLLEQCDLHYQWVQIISRINRLGDMLEVAAQVTVVDQLDQNWRHIQRDMQQEFASRGLKDYRSIFDRFAQPVNEIQAELEMLVRLAQAKSDINRTESSEAEHLGETNSAQLFHDDLPIESDWMRYSEPIDLGEMFAEKGEKPTVFLKDLIRLNQLGEIIIYRKPKS